jgi:hypothetical protein
MMPAIAAAARKPVETITTRGRREGAACLGCFRVCRRFTGLSENVPTFNRNTPIGRPHQVRVDVVRCVRACDPKAGTIVSTANDGRCQRKPARRVQKPKRLTPAMASPESESARAGYRTERITVSLASAVLAGMRRTLRVAGAELGDDARHHVGRNRPRVAERWHGLTNRGHGPAGSRVTRGTHTARRRNWRGRAARWICTSMISLRCRLPG